MKRAPTVAAALAGLAAASAVALISSGASAQACGGNNTSVNAPITCNASKAGIDGSVSVTADGHITVTFSSQIPSKPGDWVQVIAHSGLSGGGGPEHAVADPVAPGSTTKTVTLLASECGGQVDVKYVRGGTPTTDHISDVWRIMGPVIYLPNCNTEETTTTNGTTTSTQATTPSTSTPGLLTSTTTSTTTPGPSGTLPGTL